MMRVSEKERWKARMRDARVVVRCCRRRPEAREKAERTCSVSLNFLIKKNYVGKRSNFGSEPALRTWPLTQQRYLPGHSHSYQTIPSSYLSPKHPFPQSEDVHLASPYPQKASYTSQYEGRYAQGEQLEGSDAYAS